MATMTERKVVPLTVKSVSVGQPHNEIFQGNDKIATVNGYNYDDGGDCLTHEETAYLLAAAPQLLKAAKEALAFLQDPNRWEKKNIPNRRYLPTLLREAIAATKVPQ